MFVLHPSQTKKATSTNLNEKNKAHEEEKNTHKRNIPKQNAITRALNDCTRQVEQE
jgi:hypothetical protein